MGAGNVCVHQKFEDLLYVDREEIDIYTFEDEDGCSVSMTGREAREEGYGCEFNNWNETASYFSLDDFKSNFISYMEKNTSFTRAKDASKSYYYRGEEVLVENGLYEIIIKDNLWSYAFMLVKKESEYGDDSLLGLQKKHFDSYFKSMKVALFEQASELYAYSGAWTSKLLTYEQSRMAA